MMRAIGKRWLRLQEFRTRDYKQKARYYYGQFQTMLNVLKPYIGEIKGRKILDIGCGRFYPFSLLLNSLGNNVTGIDIDYIGANDPCLMRLGRIMRHNGLQKLAEELLYKALLRDQVYHKALREVSTLPLTAKGIVFRQEDAQSMSFTEETFDVVISVAVFEHLANVAQAVSELARVMRKGGIAYIDIHLFTTPSGGHHLFWQNPEKVPPWDHLRQRNVPLTAYLNEYRESEYLELLQEKLEILEVLDVDKGEGKELLNAEIRAELQNYSEEELLKHGIIIIARKGAED